MLALVKLAMRITTNDFDTELNNLIAAALIDLDLADVTEISTPDAIVILAVTTYCKMHFGEPDEYDRLKKSYDEQKAQLSMATGYTSWS